MDKRSYYWIKLNTAYLSDAKYLKQSDTTKFHYIALYLLACEGDSGGLLLQNGEILSVNDMAFLLHETEENLKVSIDNLIKIGFMSVENSGAYNITRFMEEQGKASFGAEEDKKRAQWRERQDRHRSKAAIKQDVDTDKDVDTDIDIDIEGHSNVTRDKNVTDSIENPVFENPIGFSQPEEGLIDSFKIAKNSSICSPEEDSSTHAEPACMEVKIGEFIPFPAVPADDGILSIGEFLENLIISDKAETALINSEEDENLLPETECQQRFLGKTFVDKFKTIEDKNRFQRLEKYFVGEALIANIVISKSFKYEILLRELEEQIPEFFRNR